MVIEMKVPSPGESITEVQISRWLVQNGDIVKKDQIIAEIDSDKATLEVPAENAGKITIVAQEGAIIKVGEVMCAIDTSISGPLAKESSIIQKEEVIHQPPVTIPSSDNYEGKMQESKKITPLAAKIMEEEKISAENIQGSGPYGKILKNDVLRQMHRGEQDVTPLSGNGARTFRREKISMLRRKISERLVAVKNQTAMLTTFNEIDMSAAIALRSKYKEIFKEKYNIGLGFMSLFTKAACEALKLYPAVNSHLENDELILFDYCDIGIAVSTPKGLMVPVLRNAERMTLAQIEREIKELAIKAREGKISIEELSGGTFTISNGGVFGSMLSTPILNPPQSAILGMHNIVERPVAINGKVEIRPIMYVALSYDHRVIDGRESVGFLYKIKEMIENPVRMLFGGKDPEEILLNL